MRFNTRRKLMLFSDIFSTGKNKNFVQDCRISARKRYNRLCLNVTLQVNLKFLEALKYFNYLKKNKYKVADVLFIKNRTGLHLCFQSVSNASILLYYSREKKSQYKLNGFECK